MKRVSIICLILLVSLSFVSADINDCSNVVGLYHFDGDADDSSGNGNNGTVIGAISNPVGRVNGAFDFDGVDDSIKIENDVNTYLNMTQGSISLWYKPNGYIKNSRLFSFEQGGDSLYLYLSQGKILYAMHGSDSATPYAISTSIQDTRIDKDWHHIVYTWDVNGGPETLSLTFDGTRIIDNDIISTPTAYSGFAYIGSINGGYVFNGSIDEVIIYDRVLNSTEINELHDAGTAGTALTCGECVPRTCSDLGYECGDWLECGSPLNCGTCTGGLQCSAGVCAVAPVCNDVDGDGYNITISGSCGVEDCDDDNSSINPGAIEVCGDGIDNDCNSGTSDVCLTYQCSDGIDNDGDEKIDLADPGCSGSADNSEVDEITFTCLPAFPGAEGMGACSVGGREGQVIIVNTLSDNPADGMTFREAVTTSGPRIVVFNVSGIIDLDSVLEITNPYITIAGESSPDGVLITGWSVRIKAHDVIIRHMRFRNGCVKCFAAGNCESNGDTLSVYGYPMPYNGTYRLDAYNIIIDHSSISWGCDETMDFAAESALVENITVSNSIIAEGVNDAHSEANHARGLFMWGKHTLPGETIRVSFHQNLVMSFYSRLPLANFNVSFDFVNNVVYNFNSIYSPTIEPLTGYRIETNMIHNYIKPGPNSFAPWNVGIGGMEIVVHGDGSKGHMSGDPYEMIYSVGNIGYTRLTQTGDDWNVAEGWSPTNMLSKDYQKITPFLYSGGLPITYETMNLTFADEIAGKAGANACSVSLIDDCRDDVDKRLIREYNAGDQGNYINMADVVFPTFTTPAAPIDTDSDGMADDWETSKGMNVGIDDSASIELGYDYTNIERYLHYLTGYVEGSGEPCNSTILDADRDCSGCVSIGEMDDYLNLWLAGEPGVTIELAGAALEFWPGNC